MNCRREMLGGGGGTTKWDGWERGNKLSQNAIMENMSGCRQADWDQVLATHMRRATTTPLGMEVRDVTKHTRTGCTERQRHGVYFPLLRGARIAKKGGETTT